MDLASPPVVALSLTIFVSLGILTAVEKSRPAIYFACGPYQKLALFHQLVNRVSQRISAPSAATQYGSPLEVHLCNG